MEDTTNEIQGPTENVKSEVNQISSEYTIENDIYKFPGYNNTKIYNYINDFLLQDFSGLNGHKIYIRGEDGFIFEITTTENEEEILKDKNKNIHNSSVIDLGECSNLLKQRYFQNQENISLIILKFEKETDISHEKNIQFEIYEPFNQT